MKATGIVRRIDDLGRVVIPKEIRRTMHIRDGEPLEIYTDCEGEVIFKKYSPIRELTEIATRYTDALNKTCAMQIVVIDRDIVVACAGAYKKELLDKKITIESEKLIEGRGLYVYKDNAQKIMLIQGGDTHFIKSLMPIFAEGDVTGAVAVVGNADEKSSSELEIKSIQAAAIFLGKHLES